MDILQGLQANTLILQVLIQGMGIRQHIRLPDIRHLVTRQCPAIHRRLGTQARTLVTQPILVILHHPGIQLRRRPSQADPRRLLQQGRRQQQGTRATATATVTHQARAEV